MRFGFLTLDIADRQLHDTVIQVKLGSQQIGYIDQERAVDR